jgi:hypothetical protein
MQGRLIATGGFQGSSLEMKGDRVSLKQLLNGLLLLERRIHAHATAGRADAGAATGRTPGLIGGRLQLTPVPWHRKQRPLPVTAPSSQSGHRAGLTHIRSSITDGDLMCR